MNIYTHTLSKESFLVSAVKRVHYVVLAVLFALTGLLSLSMSSLTPRAQAQTIGGQWEQVSTGGDFNCALAEGAVYCRGVNYIGQLGDGTTTNRTSLVKVKGLLTEIPVTHIVSGGDHACAIADSEVYCWGANWYGQLGDGTTTSRSTPVKVTQAAGVIQGKTVTQVTANWSHTCAVADGEAYCWGYNSSGQLGDGTTTNRSTPVKVTQAAGMLQGKTVTQVTASWSHTCAVADGETYCWGENGDGQLGDGTTPAAALLSR